MPTRRHPNQPKPLPIRGGCLAEVQLAPIRNMHRHCPNSDFVDFEKKLDSPNQVFFQNRSKRRPSAAESLFTSVHKNNLLPTECTKSTKHGSDFAQIGAKDTQKKPVEPGGRTKHHQNPEKIRASRHLYQARATNSFSNSCHFSLSFAAVCQTQRGAPSRSKKKASRSLSQRLQG